MTRVAPMPTAIAPRTELASMPMITFIWMLRRPGLWNARQDPEERPAKLPFSFRAYAASFGSGHEGLNLNVHESCTRTIAAQDVSIRRISECDHCSIATA